MQRLLRAALALSVCTLSLSASDSARPGYGLAHLANPAGAAATCSLPKGDFVTFDGASVDRWDRSGMLVQHLGTLAAFVYPSFVEPTPDGLSVVIGESGNGTTISGNLYLARLDGTSLTHLAALPFNYDGAFLPSGELIVSAAQGGFGGGNDLVRVDVSSGATTVVGHVDGASGPVAVARGGDVYYATQPAGFPPPLGATEVLRWSATLLAAGTPLEASNAIVVAAGFESASSLAIDPHRGRIYLAENDYGSGAFRILHVKGSAPASPVLVSSDTWITSLRFQSLGGAATFDAFQPDDGISLVYETTDFGATNDLVTVAPRRPTLALTGPGLVGVGSVSLTLSGGRPNATALLTYCPQSMLLPSETSYPMPRFLLHTTFTLAATARWNTLVPTDANGAATVQIFNPGGMQGLWSFQFHVGNAAGTLIGASDVAPF